MKHSQADNFEARIRDLYLRAGPRVDTATATRLRAARREALEDRHAHHALRWMAPTGACAVALLAIFTVWQPLHRPGTMTPVATTSVDATQVLPPDADQTDPALYQNLGFYAWLARQPSTQHTTARH